jgi:hypothetical protein
MCRQCQKRNADHLTILLFATRWNHPVSHFASWGNTDVSHKGFTLWVSVCLVIAAPAAAQVTTEEADADTAAFVDLGCYAILTTASAI